MRLKTNITSLTSIRGFAAWWVVLFHFRARMPLEDASPISAFLDNGYLAVDLFFVLSGFVIFLNYEAYFHTISALSLRKFFLTRFARIYPLHATMMVLFLSVPLAQFFFSTRGVVDASRFGPLEFAVDLLLLQDWGIVSPFTWNIPAWSISAETFAYLLFPCIAFLLTNYISSAYSILGVIALSLSLLAGVFFWMGEASLGTGIGRLGLIRCALEFLAGVAVCRLYLTVSITSFIWPLASLLAFGLLSTMYALGFAPSYLLMPLAFTCLIFALAVSNGSVLPGINLQILHFMGTISYSTYLVHYFVADWIKFLVVSDATPSLAAAILYVLGVFIASVLLFYGIEVPGKRLLIGKSRTTPARFAPTPDAA